MLERRVLGRLLEVTMHLACGGEDSLDATAGAFFAGGMIYAIRECWYVPENGNYRVGFRGFLQSQITG